MKHIGIYSLSASPPFVSRFVEAIGRDGMQACKLETDVKLTLDAIVVLSDQQVKGEQLKDWEELLKKTLASRVNRWLPIVLISKTDQKPQIGGESYLIPSMEHRLEGATFAELLKQRYKRTASAIFPKHLIDVRQISLTDIPGEESRVWDRLRVLSQHADSFQRRLKMKALLPFLFALVISLGFVVFLVSSLLSERTGKSNQSSVQDAAQWVPSMAESKRSELDQLLKQLHATQALPTREEAKILNTHWRWLPILLDAIHRGEPISAHWPETKVKALEQSWSQSLELMQRYLKGSAQPERVRLLGTLLHRVFDPNVDSPVTLHAKSFWNMAKQVQEQKIKSLNSAGLTLSSLAEVLNGMKKEMIAWQVHEPMSQDVMDQDVQSAIDFVAAQVDKKGLELKIRPKKIILDKSIEGRASIELILQDANWTISPSLSLSELSWRTFTIQRPEVEMRILVQGKIRQQGMTKFPFQNVGEVLLPNKEHTKFRSELAGISIEWEVESMPVLPGLIGALISK